jgi:hypothetical protein
MLHHLYRVFAVRYLLALIVSRLGAQHWVEGPQGPVVKDTPKLRESLANFGSRRWIHWQGFQGRAALRLPWDGASYPTKN